MTTLTTATIMAARNLLARDNFSDFCRLVDIPGAPVEDDETMLLPAWDRPTTAHLQLLMDKFQRIETGEIPRLMLFLPPGSAKSTYGSKLFPAWFLGRKRGRSCGSAWKRDPDSGVIGVEKGPLIPVV